MNMMFNEASSDKSCVFFHAVCIIGAIGCLIWCSIEFISNEDLCEVSFSKYATGKDDIYPAVSLCLHYPFSQKEIQEYGKPMLENYYNFLNGKYYNISFLDLDIEKITLNMEDHLIKAIASSSLTDILDDSVTQLGFTTSFMYGSTKCFTFEMPTGMKLFQATIAINNSIFPSFIRPTHLFMVPLSFTYPKQLFKGYEFGINAWPSTENKLPTYYNTVVGIKGVEILRRRNKSGIPCTDWQSYDDEIKNNIEQWVACRPPYWNTNETHTLPPCKSKEQLGNITFRGMEEFLKIERSKNETINNPCNEIMKLDLDTHNMDLHEHLLSHDNMAFTYQGKYPRTSVTRYI